MKAIRLAAMGLWLVCFGDRAALAENLVLNPGFETGDFTDWTTRIQNAYASGVGRSNAHSGQYEAVFGEIGIYDTIQQTLPTVAGQAYLLSFWLESYPAGGGSMQPYWNGVQLDDIHSYFSDSYQLYTYAVVASGPATTLLFAGYNAPGIDLLDDISVVAAPEPATGELGLLALAVCCLVGLRRASLHFKLAKEL